MNENGRAQHNVRYFPSDRETEGTVAAAFSPDAGKGLLSFAWNGSVRPHIMLEFFLQTCSSFEGQRFGGEVGLGEESGGLISCENLRRDDFAMVMERIPTDAVSVRLECALERRSVWVPDFIAWASPEDVSDTGDEMGISGAVAIIQSTQDAIERFIAVTKLPVAGYPLKSYRVARILEELSPR